MIVNFLFLSLGFEETSSNKSLVYRVEDFPGLAFMIKMSVYKERMKGSLKSCCSERYSKYLLLI